MGPAVCTTQRAGSRPAVVATASPRGSGPSGSRSLTARHSARISGPPRRWIAPSTPPPPSNEELAALTMASTSCAVMSPVTNSTSLMRLSQHATGHQGRAGHGTRHHHDRDERHEKEQEHGYPEA